MSRLPTWVALGALACVTSLSLFADAAPKKSKKPTTAEAAKKTEEKKAEEPSTDFDKQAAITAIGEVRLQKCKATNAVKGEGHVMITFAPTGGAQAATIDKGPWVGTPVAKCMAKEFKKAKVPAFKGEAITVGKM